MTPFVSNRELWTDRDPNLLVDMGIEKVILTFETIPSLV